MCAVPHTVHARLSFHGVAEGLAPWVSTVWQDADTAACRAFAVLCANFSQAVESAREVAEAPFTRLFPVHDTGGGKGASKAQARELAEDLQREGAEHRWRQKFQ